MEDTINFTLVLDTVDCSQIINIVHTSGSYSETFETDEFTCEDSIVTISLNNVESGDLNYLTVPYGVIAPVGNSLCPAMFQGIGSLGSKITTFIIILGIIMVIGSIILLMVVLRRIQEGGGMESLSDIPDVIKIVGVIFLSIFLLVIVLFAVVIALGGIC